MVTCCPYSHCRMARLAAQLAVDPLPLAWSWAGVSGGLTPIKQSRVISALSCSSLQPSVPAGRSGILKNLSSHPNEFASAVGKCRWASRVI